MISKITKINEYIGHFDSIYSINNYHLPGFFISAGADGVLALWEVENPDSSMALLKSDCAIYSCHIYSENDDKFIIVGLSDGSAHILKIGSDTNQLIKSIKLTKEAIYRILDFDNSLYFVCGNGEYYIVNKSDFVVKNYFKVGEKNLRDIAIIEGFAFIASGDSRIYVHDLSKLEVIDATIDSQGHTSGILKILSIKIGNEQIIFSAGKDAKLCKWIIDGDKNKLHLDKSVISHNYLVHGLEISKDLRWLATGSMDKSIRIWDPVTLKLLKVIDHKRYLGHTSSVNTLIKTEDNRLISGSDDRRIILWSID